MATRKAKAKKPSYNDETRSEVCALLKAEGYPESKGALTAVAERVGIPAMTISRWFNGAQNPPPNQLVNEKEFDLASLVRSELQAIFGVLVEKREDASYRDLSTAFGIMADKLFLLEGKPNNRTLHTLLSTIDDADLDAIINDAE